MKRIIFGLVIFMGFAVIGGFCGGKKQQEADNKGLSEDSEWLSEENKKLSEENKKLSEENAKFNAIYMDLSRENAELKAPKEQLTPVTLEIVNQANKAGANTLRSLGYYLSTPLMLVTNNPDTKVNEENGILFIKDTNMNRLDEIQSSAKGIFVSYSPNPADKESFEISFPGISEEVKLKFERDKTKNNFVLTGVLAPKNMSFSSGGIQPYLCILLRYENEKDNPMYQNISSATQVTSVSSVTSNSQTWGNSSSQLIGSRNIIANGILTKDNIVAYIQSKNNIVSGKLIEDIVGIYMEEARKENINLDIAIAQMCEGTNFLNDLNRLAANNYGDLHNIMRPKEKASFPSMELGIRVHIQQLKYYASQTGLSYPAVDQPRLKRIEKNRGKYTTLDQLFSVWVSRDYAVYRNSINKILDEMYHFRNSGI